MTKPNIYTVVHPEDLSPPMANQGFCVDVVLASDYAALEQEISALDAINRQLSEKVLALVAENWNLRDVLRRLINGRPGGTYFIKWEKLCLKALNETTATDAAIAEFRAQGVELFEQQMHADITNTDALEFAQQLRAEASK